jgi:hypothetical protein
MGTLPTILRRSFYTAATVSSLLLLATLIFWPVSYYRNSGVTYVCSSAPAYSLYGQSGRCVAGFNSQYFPWGDKYFILSSAKLYKGGLNDWSYLTLNSLTPTGGNLGTDATTSLGLLRWRSPGTFEVAIVCIPFAYLALLFSILPLLAVHSLRRRRRAARVGLCPKCGYDQRAHQPGDHCPECGTLILPPKAGKTDKIAPQP